MASNAVNASRVSQVVGYQLTGGNFATNTPNLPMRIAILGEANTANQTGLTQGKEVVSAKEAADLYGDGSPIHSIMRILRPVSGGGVQGIPTVVYPTLETGTPTAAVRVITVTGTATGSGTHFLKIAGRTSLDGQNYSYTVNKTDTPTQVAQKIADAVNNVYGCPVTATVAAGVVTLTAGWKGVSSTWLSVSMGSDNASLGVTYTVTETVDGAGLPDFSAALAAMDEAWNTIVINGQSFDESSILDLLEAKNGKPSATVPTGNYASTIMRPFVAFTGSFNADDSAATDARKNEVTIAVCPTPNSEGLPFEAAANYALLSAVITQDTPHIDLIKQALPDMPSSDGNIGQMADYNNRDLFVKKGASTVTYQDGKYIIADFVTTYHPTGELVPQHRYVRDLLGIDFNVYYGYYLLEQTYVVGHVIVDDNDDVTVGKIIKPKMWRAIIDQYAVDLSSRALIADVGFMQESIVVNLGVTNPNRLESNFKYKRSGTVRISSTTAEAGFNFGE